ncbi:MAG: HEPN domain-containing protein [Cyclobacteriaceae bacterium]|nr:HEPN domain-containing protein [Cyclobacteriaceae bacterium]
METQLSSVTETQQVIIRRTISLIIESFHPEKIICYGTRSNSSNVWSSFTSPDNNNSSMAIDLLIILQDKDKGKRESISDSVEKLSNDFLAIIPIVHSVDAVNNSLEIGNPFFVRVYRSGVLLHDNDTVPLITPSRVVDPHVQSSFVQGSKRKFDLAQAFYQTATDCLQESRYDVAVLMLHQAVELTCISLLRTCIGYKPTTHSIRRLFLLLENITLNVHTIFPRSTESELQIFNILQRAYSDVRYKEDYSVAADNVLTLHNRVWKFQNMALILCQNKWRETEQQCHDIQSKQQVQKRLIVGYDVSSFESIGLDAFSDVILQRGGSERIEIESDSDMTHMVETRIEENRLWVTMKNDSFEVIPASVIRLTYSTLSSIVVHHSGTVTCKEPIETESLAIIQNGKGRVDLQVDVTILDATVTKTGALAISGCALKANILNTGPGSFEGIDLETSEAKVTIKDTGGISIQVDDELNAFLEGDGNLQLKGEPRLKRFTMD